MKIENGKEYLLSVVAGDVQVDQKRVQVKYLGLGKVFMNDVVGIDQLIDPDTLQGESYEEGEFAEFSDNRKKWEYSKFAGYSFWVSGIERSFKYIRKHVPEPKMKPRDITDKEWALIEAERRMNVKMGGRIE